MESLKRIVSVFNPGVIYIQETKAKRKNKFNIDNYESFELPRSNSAGGGLLTAVHKSLKPVSVSEENDILVVEGSLKGFRIRFINGYGPQEYAPEQTRQSFFTSLDLEVKKSLAAGVLVCIEMDSNAKLGPTHISSDPKPISENGKMLEKVIIENDLVLVNGTDICDGAVTRHKQTINGLEESILDHFIVCKTLFQFVTSMKVDEEEKFTLTKYSNKAGSKTDVKKSDHRSLFLFLNVSWKPNIHRKDKRTEIFDYKNKENFEAFICMTNDSEELRNCFKNDDDELEKCSVRWLKIMRNIIKCCFTKIRIKKNGLKPELQQLFKDKEYTVTQIANLEKLKNYGEAEKLRVTLSDIDESIGKMCAEKNRAHVKDLLKSSDEEIDGVNQSKIWDLKKRLLNKNVILPPAAKKNENGILVTDRDELEELYVETYETRLAPNPTSDDLEELKMLKSQLFSFNTRSAQSVVTEDWTIRDLEVALNSCKNNKARDIYGHTYELFKYGGKDLKGSLLSMFNRVRRSQTYPSIFFPSTITSIWKKKGEQSNLNNDRGIFNVTKIRSILDKLLYNDIYDVVDVNMSNSNIGARKSRNIRDHLFVINAILNEAVNGTEKLALDIQIYDVAKCFDKLDYVSTANDLYSAGVQNDKFVVIGNSNKTCEVAIKLPWGSNSKSITFHEIEMQGTVLAPLKCSISIDKIGKFALEHMHGDLFKYKRCVAIPPLAMIDDICD